MKSVCSECIDIGLPVNRVFGFVSDVTRWPLWLSFVVCAQRKGEAEAILSQDQEVEICMQRGKRRWRESFDVIRFVSDAFLWLEGSLSAARRIEFRFEQRRNSTRVHCSISNPVYGGALGVIRDTLFSRGPVRKDVERSLLSLKAALEESDQAEGIIGIQAGGQARKAEERSRGNANEPLPA
jgi:hypothetical protein